MPQLTSSMLSGVHVKQTTKKKKKRIVFSPQLMCKFFILLNSAFNIIMLSISAWICYDSRLAAKVQRHVLTTITFFCKLNSCLVTNFNTDFFTLFEDLPRRLISVHIFEEFSAHFNLLLWFPFYRAFWNNTILHGSSFDWT